MYVSYIGLGIIIGNKFVQVIESVDMCVSVHVRERERKGGGKGARLPKKSLLSRGFFV